jgi:hypothetical protein
MSYSPVDDRFGQATSPPQQQMFNHVNQQDQYIRPFKIGNDKCCDYFDMNPIGCACCWLTIPFWGLGLFAPLVGSFRYKYDEYGNMVPNQIGSCTVC